MTNNPKCYLKIYDEHGEHIRPIEKETFIVRNCLDGKILFVEDYNNVINLNNLEKFYIKNKQIFYNKNGTFPAQNKIYDYLSFDYMSSDRKRSIIINYFGSSFNSSWLFETNEKNSFTFQFAYFKNREGSLTLRKKELLKTKITKTNELEQSQCHTYNQVEIDLCTQTTK